MKQKITKIVITILIWFIFLGGVITYLNKDVIFQRGNPIPYLKKVIFLREDEPYKKVFDNKEIYISKGREHYIKTQDSLIELVENKYNVNFVERAGSGYIFQSENITVIMGTEVYLKNYNVWEISAKQRTELADLIPMVRIKGKLYLDTGKESDIGARCGVMDGKITSTVEPFEKPTQDNQSNFGSGYEYQFINDSSIDIYMNEKWIRFEIKDKEKQRLANINDAVSSAIKDQSSSYASGETTTEGHIILETKEKNGTITVYTIASYGAFGFENGVFTKVSGTGSIPTVITFSQKENGEYTLLEYKEPMDGSGYGESVRKMFPPSLHNRVFAAHDDYGTLVQQQEAQAEEYLKSIGRTAEVSAAHVKKELANINVQASNKLFSEFTKYNSFLNNCPYWLGTTEKVEDGVRYIYETSQSKTRDGCDVIIFQKKEENGAVIEEYKYKIVGSEPQLVEGEGEN